MEGDLLLATVRAIAPVVSLGSGRHKRGFDVIRFLRDYQLRCSCEASAAKEVSSNQPLYDTSLQTRPQDASGNNMHYAEAPECVCVCEQSHFESLPSAEFDNHSLRCA